ncbi:MAG: hypothetical protein COA84_07545 [Robiginitomaculum sp.]|nr:MAG: hypothetical protein COA84_07545 [Robiginitomaculum sp.]
MPIRLDAGSQGVRGPQSRGSGGAIAPAGDLGIEAFGQRLIEIDNFRKSRQRQETDAADALKVAQDLSDFRLNQGTALQEGLDGYNGADPGFADAAYTNFQNEAETLVKGAPERQRQALQARLIAFGEGFSAQARDGERARRREFSLTNIGVAIEGQSKSLLVNPSNLRDALGDLDLVAAGAPPDLQAKVKKEARQKYGSAYVDGMLDNAPTSLRAELASGSLDDVLSAAQKAKALGAVDNELARRALQTEAQNKAAAREAKAAQDKRDVMDLITLSSLADDELASIAANGLGVDGFNLARYMELQNPQGAARFTAKRKAALKAFESSADFGQLSGGEIAGRLADLRPEPGTPGFAAKADTFEAARKRAEQHLTARNKDPVGYVQNDPQVRAAQSALAQIGEDEGDVAGAQQDLIRTELAAQRSLGIPLAKQKVLRAGQAKDIVTQIAALDNDGRGIAIRDAINSTQVYGEFQSKVIKELIDAGLPEDAQGLVMLEGNNVAQTELARAIDDRDVINKLIDKATDKDVDEAVIDAIAPLTETFAYDDTGLELSVLARNVVNTLARQKVVRDGLSAKNAAKAAALAFNNQYSFADGYRIPAGIANETITVRDPGAVRGSGTLIPQEANQEIPLGNVIAVGARASLEALANPDRKAERLLLAAFLGIDPRLSAKKRTAFTQDGIEADGVWKTSEDESGLMLIVTPDGVPVPVRGANGAAIKLSWVQLEEIGRTVFDAPAAILRKKNVKKLLGEAQ